MNPTADRTEKTGDGRATKGRREDGKRGGGANVNDDYQAEAGEVETKPRHELLHIQGRQTGRKSWHGRRISPEWIM